jgi:retron-type reverse transcriptase
MDMGRILFGHRYNEIISLENLLEAWQEFVRGKRSRSDVQEFELHLMEHLFSLHKHLAKMTYRHSPYQAFVISDPKTRSIHKASVTDRVLHRALYRKLYPFFDRTFISDSFSCRIGKGTHLALERFTRLARQVSMNHHKTVWVLKCDVRKFFASIDQRILIRIVDPYIADKRIVRPLETIVRSFSSSTEGIGLPLGNLTSQLFANVYMNVFDQFMKQHLRVKHYIRYADDFVILSREREYLERLLPILEKFLWQVLHLRLHPEKIELRTVASGVDFLGWVHFSDHRVLRTTTKRRMLKAMRHGATEAAAASSCGLLKYGNTFLLSRFIDESPKFSP